MSVGKLFVFWQQTYITSNVTDCWVVCEIFVIAHALLVFQSINNSFTTNPTIKLIKMSPAITGLPENTGRVKTCRFIFVKMVPKVITENNFSNGYLSKILNYVSKKKDN